MTAHSETRRAGQPSPDEEAERFSRELARLVAIASERRARMEAAQRRVEREAS